MRAPKGMSLIEILVVVSIVGLIALVVGIGINAYLQQSRIDTTRSQLDAVASSIVSYAADRQQLPYDLYDLVDTELMEKAEMKDPWGVELAYRPGPTGDMGDYVLCSAGPDQLSNTEDDLCVGGDG